jgi:tetratricopeptide (TPR) repeat protein
MQKILLSVLLAAISAAAFAQQESSLQIARKHYQEDNYAEALKFLEKASVEEPDNAGVPYLSSRAYLDMNNYRKAAVFMEKAIAMDSTKPQWMYECGLIYYAIPDNKKSLQFILLAGEKGYKKSSDYLENLANAYININQYDKGLEILTEVVKKKPEDPELLYVIGDAYYKTGKYQEAIDHWDRVFKIEENAEALYMIGMAYQKKGEKQKGQQICDRAIEMDPSLRSKRQRMGGDF